eukprot:UN07285
MVLISFTFNHHCGLILILQKFFKENTLVISKDDSEPDCQVKLE